jgi:hypothetical protein
MLLELIQKAAELGTDKLEIDSKEGQEQVCAPIKGIAREAREAASHRSTAPVWTGCSRRWSTTRTRKSPAGASTSAAFGAISVWRRRSQAVNHDTMQVGRLVNQSTASLTRLGSLIAPFHPLPRPRSPS